MEDKMIKYVKVIGIISVLIGCLLLIAGFNYNPGVEVTYVGEYNETYAESNSNTQPLIPYINSNRPIQPQDVHPVRNISDFDSNTSEQITNLIDTENKTTIVKNSEGIVLGNYIVNYNENYYVFSSQLNSNYTPMQLILSGLFTLLFGFYILKRLSNTGVELPEDIETSETSEWKYE